MAKARLSFVSFTLQYRVFYYQFSFLERKLERNFTTKILICAPHQILQYNVESFCIAVSFFYENFVLVVTPVDDADEETAHRHDK